MLAGACVDEYYGRAVVAPCWGTSLSLEVKEGFQGEVAFELSLRMSKS